MDEKVEDTALKIGAGRYRQERGLIRTCGGEVARLGSKVLLLCGNRSWEAVREPLLASLEEAGVEPVVCQETGYCSHENARKWARRAQETGAEEVVGVGGGKLCDLAKAVGQYAGLGVATIPTSIATCAPFTSVSIMYTQEGKTVECWRLPNELDACLLDPEVIVRCPERYAAAGILDAMAKKIEMLDGHTDVPLDSNEPGRYLAFTMASTCYDMLVKEGRAAYADIRAHRLTKAVEDVAFVNVCAAGVVSNLTRSYGQSALGHAFYDGARVEFTRECAGTLHGELVAVALLCQLVYNGQPEQVEPLRGFMRDLGMPLTLTDCGIRPTEHNLDVIERMLADTRFVGDTAEERERLHRAVRAMDTHVEGEEVA